MRSGGNSLRIVSDSRRVPGSRSQSPPLASRAAAARFWAPRGSSLGLVAATPPLTRGSLASKTGSAMRAMLLGAGVLYG